MNRSMSDHAHVASDGLPAAAILRRPPRRVVIEFLRYFVASGGALGVDFGLYQATLHLGGGYPVAALIGFAAGAVVAYLASVAWVFEARSIRSPGAEFGVFVAVGVAGLLLTEALLRVEIGQFGMPPGWSKLCAAGVVFVFNFALRKAILFRARAR
jgi:putative flippase GtrA